MKCFVCTPRGCVIEVFPPYTQSVSYYDTKDGRPNKVRNYHDDSFFEAAYVTRAISDLPMRAAPNIHIARVDFYADQVLKDTLADIKRMFAYAYSDRASMARRAKRQRQPGSFGICVDG